MAIFTRKSKSAPPAHRPDQPASAQAAHTAQKRAADPAMEAKARQYGKDMLARARAHKSGLLSAKFYSDKLMSWSMKDHDFKVQLFRFVDAFPMLTTPEMVHDHLVDYLTQPGVKLPAGIDVGLRASGMAKKLAASTISKQITGMGQKFIAGTDARSALPGLKSLWNDGIAFSVDLLGEACVSDAEADAYQAKYLDLVGNLPEEVASWKTNDRLEKNHLGVVPRTNVSIKISSLSAKCDPIDKAGAINDLMSRLRPILELAKERGVFINFDMEQFELKDLTLELFMRCCEEIDFHAGIAMQAYLKSGVEDAKRISTWAREKNRSVTVRLVKGAYWDFETIHAEEAGWPCPVWNEKWLTDQCFEDMTRVFLDHADTGEGGICLALGSHNVRSIGAALAELDKRNLPRNAIELQMLHGMADQLKHAAADMDLRIREYVPVGEMIPGMAYLVRRLLENTSNESWLKAGFLDDVNEDVLLAQPAPPPGSEPKRDLTELAPERHVLAPAVEGVGDGRPFFSESCRDFAIDAQRNAFKAAVNSAKVPQIAIKDDEEALKQALEEADNYFPTWRDTDPRERANVLTRVADIFRKRRDEISGIIIKENGKCWRDADADVCEAIDFCEYYARNSIELFQRQRLGRFIGELDQLWYQPRGICAVISPWNFPLAIPTGMVTAALVTGNTVILKPAEQTLGIASILQDTLYEAGCPLPAFSLLPATGEVTGAALVRDPRIALLAFTGSKAVGLDIIKAAGITHDEQPQVKRVVCEMGGKNAIIVDSSADLDEAVLGVRQSAFGFQGQKCSACSRCIVVDPEGPDGRATKIFLSRIVDSTRSLIIGDPAHGGTDVGPVIDKQAKDTILRFIEAGKRESTLELAMDIPEGLEATTGRDYVAPHIFSGVTMDHTIGREEIFGPVLSIMHARTFDEALSIANASVYKLTGGLYSRKPAHIDKAKRDFRVGNLYINRGCTGALVGRMPFGGAGMSGIGTKAGGPDYLLHFVDPRACCENTMRRGFAPEL